MTDLHGHAEVKCFLVEFAFGTVAALGTLVRAGLGGGEGRAGAAAEGGAVVVQHASLAHQAWGQRGAAEKDCHGDRGILC